MNANQNKEKSWSLTQKLIAGLIFFAIGISILWEFIGPCRIRYRPKAFCSRVESDAQNIAATIADHFADPKQLDVTRRDIEANVTIDNPWTFTRCGMVFYIHVVDRSGKCPVEYQKNHPEWNEGIFTLRMGGG